MAQGNRQDNNDDSKLEFYLAAAKEMRIGYDHNNDAIQTYGKPFQYKCNQVRNVTVLS